MQSTSYQQKCLSDSIVPSAVMGGALSAFQVVLHGAQFTPRLFMSHALFIYTFNALKCPMEAIHGRKSVIHNSLAGGIVGYVGVKSGNLGIPFVDGYFFYRYPYISRPMAGCLVYGAIGGFFGMAAGKSI